MINFLLIHLGKQPNIHFWSNIKLLKKRFPSIKIYVALEKNHRVPLEISELDIEIRRINRTDEHKRHLLNMSHDRKFRDGFWIYTLERLFFMEQIHSEFPEEALLHVESDVLLLSNFPIDKIMNMTKIMWFAYNEIRDVSSLFYSPHICQTIWFQNEIIKEIGMNPTHTDMTLLKNIALKYPQKIDYFPTLSNEIPSLLSKEYHNNQSLIEKCMTFEEYFDGIFDSAPIGMWLLGQDPKNNYGTTVLHESSLYERGDSLVNPVHIQYFMNEDDNISISDGTKKVNLYCIHVHSKSMSILSPSSSMNLKKYIELSRISKTIRIKSFRIFIILIVQNFRQKTLLRYIAYSPFFRRITLSIKTTFSRK